MNKEAHAEFLKKADYKSPLLFPVTYDRKKKTIHVLDETRLPWEALYIEVRSLADAEKVLYEMKTRAFGQVLLFLYTAALEASIGAPDKKLAVIDTVAEHFKKKRPTFDFMSIAGLLKKFAADQPQKTLFEVVEGFIHFFDAGRKKRALALAEVLPDPANIMTVCNLNGELVYLYYALKMMKKDARFYVSETRPYLQGSRLTFFELKKEGIPCSLFCDNQAAVLMHDKKVNAVITGADRVNTKGDIINKIGTYALARLAGHYKIPVYVYTQYPKDVDIEHITIEERSPDEVFMYCDAITEHPDSVYPNFDITTHEYITGWNTPESLKLNDKFQMTKSK